MTDQSLSNIIATGTQLDVAMLYVKLLLQSKRVPWEKIHSLIINRWSMTGLKRVKRLAWGIIDG